MTQREAVDILKTGRNVFITGPAGSGKTHVVNEYIAYLRAHGVVVGVTASTGIAATHIGGMTIHAWSGMGIGGVPGEQDLERLSENARTSGRIKAASVLVIDEVSMLHHFRLDAVDVITRHIRKDDRPFGGLQVVLCGDFFQLPPVSRYGDPDTHFIYRSEAWKDGAFTICYLSENHRQKTDGLLAILNEIRSGDVSDGAREELKSRFRASVAGADTGMESTRLYTHNTDVDIINDRALHRIPGPEISYEMETKGRKSLVDGLKKSCLAPEMLRLRKGARVMCVKNNFDAGYVNGTLGIVVSCAPGADPIIRIAPAPGSSHAKEVTIERASWSIEEGDRVLAEIMQYPLRLAWAITVHKSQGMSLDAVETDLSRAFEPGMGYVALSRARTLAGLSIIGINERAFQVHPEVIQYDRHLRELSGKSESSLAGTDTADLARSHHEFLARVAPGHAMRNTTKEKAKKPRNRKRHYAA